MASTCGPTAVDDPARPQRRQRLRPPASPRARDAAGLEAAPVDGRRRCPPARGSLVDGLLAVAARCSPRRRRLRLVRAGAHAAPASRGRALVLRAAARRSSRPAAGPATAPRAYALAPAGCSSPSPAWTARRRRPGTAAGTALLCVGAVTPLKGYDVLVAALARSADLDWTCRGVGTPTEIEPRSSRPASAAAVRLDRPADRRGAGRDVRRGRPAGAAVPRRDVRDGRHRGARPRHARDRDRRRRRAGGSRSTPGVPRAAGRPGRAGRRAAPAG